MDTEPDDMIKKAVKLAPIKKSGKEKHQIYNYDDQDEDDLDLDYRKRESVFDYFDEDDQEDDI